MLLEGVLVMDASGKHYNVQYGASKSLFGMRNGEAIDVLIDGEWIVTYIHRDEEDGSWYLEKVDRSIPLEGLECRLTV